MLELGGLHRLEWDVRPMRVIGFDEHEVFYDCQWEHDGMWTFSGNYKRRCVFYRMPVVLFATRSERIGHAPLTEVERDAFRPDLPMRMGRTRDLKWNTEWAMGGEQLSQLLPLPSGSGALDLNAAILIPYGPKDAPKRGVVVNSINGVLTVGRLLLEAKRIQEAVNPQVSNGVGLYRLGWDKGLPSYCTGEYADRAGIMK
ncbi:MAG TPA: hypothetical protein PK760_11430 [Flavobacteriales bacterium]|nr:hypothetical protein [Flavobacteriales bacterium]